MSCGLWIQLNSFLTLLYSFELLRLPTLETTQIPALWFGVTKALVFVHVRFIHIEPSPQYLWHSLIPKGPSSRSDGWKPRALISLFVMHCRSWICLQNQAVGDKEKQKALWVFSTNGVWQLDIHMQKNKVGPLPHIVLLIL